MSNQQERVATPLTEGSIDPQLLEHFLTQLRESEYKGEIEERYGQRLMAATDNSIYQLLPAALLFPRDHEDVIIIMELLGQEPFHTIPITPRGGGTGTNGQSLTYGLVIDLSRHMNTILHLDKKNRTVTVQTGVVKDQLNAFLRPFGLFFAPELSTSNRATIGGMINTDASGQGSCEYGKTSQHTLSIKGVFPGGTTLLSQSYSRDLLQSARKLGSQEPIYHYIEALDQLILPHKEKITEHFPPLNRYVTGYDLYHYAEDSGVNLNHLFCGSEGTLGIFTEATLNLLPIPKETALVLISYNDFIGALGDTPALMASGEATSIEILDDIVLDIAKNDYIWATTEKYFEGVDYRELKALQLIEFNADSEAALKEKVERFLQYADTHPNQHRLTQHAIYGKEAVTTVYGLRKRAVGLLGAIEGNRRPIPFVEDTAVPPENLAPFIAEFKAILDQYDLTYGMFGHADAGVIHVRPALDMKLPTDQILIRTISDKVYALCEKYGGALWGEHGKGVRSEYSEEYFGSLYPIMQQIKALFDPHNQLNPGKIATTEQSSHTLYKIDELPMRGDFNRQIEAKYFTQFPDTLYCNGNGACFNYDLDAAMCPSYKATRQRINSPKGRAELMKEWLRQRSNGTVDPTFEEEVYESFSLCLSCKSCTGECPMKVNIPDAKAEFLFHYHQTRPRQKYEELLAKSESLAPLAAQFGKVSRFLGNWGPVKRHLERLGLIDLPSPEENNLKTLIRKGWVTELKEDQYTPLEQLNEEERKEAVIIVPDVFFRFYDATTLEATIQLLHKLGITLFLAPYKPSGKAQHVLGYLDQFRESAQKQHNLLTKLARYQIPLVGIEPPVTLIYRDEYRKKLNLPTPEVALIQSWLLKFLSNEPERIAALSLDPKLSKQTYQLLSHCTEKSNATTAPTEWQQLFALIGVTLTLGRVGCCGMSGAFGHLKAQEELSRKIYHQSWKNVIDREPAEQLLVTGFSCRSQVERFSHEKLQHPLTLLNRVIQ